MHAPFSVYAARLWSPRSYIIPNGSALYRHSSAASIASSIDSADIGGGGDGDERQRLLAGAEVGGYAGVNDAADVLADAASDDGGDGGGGGGYVEIGVNKVTLIRVSEPTHAATRLHPCCCYRN